MFYTLFDNVKHFTKRKNNNVNFSCYLFVKAQGLLDDACNIE